MAVNYSVKELLEVLRSDDMDAIGDALRRYSHVSVALVKADAIAPGVTDLLVKMIPDYVNARKCNKTLVEALDEDAAGSSKPATKTSGSSEQEHASDGDDGDGFDGDDEVAADDYSSMKAMDLFKLCKERGIEAEPKHRTKYYIDLLEKADSEAKSGSDADANDDDDDDDDDWDI